MEKKGVKRMRRVSVVKKWIPPRRQNAAKDNVWMEPDSQVRKLENVHVERQSVLIPQRIRREPVVDNVRWT